MAVTYFLSVLIFVVFILYYFLTTTFNYWNRKNVRGPRPLPLFGNLIDSALRRKNVGMIYNEIYERYPNEKVVGIYRMTSPALIIRDLDIVKQILIKDFNVFPDRGIKLSRKKLGDGLLHCGADIWRVIRNRFTPAFTSGKLRSMFYLFDQRGDRFLDYIDKVCLNQSDQNMCNLFQRYTIATTMAAFFNFDLDTFKDHNELFDVVDRALFAPTYATEMALLYPNVLEKYSVSIFGEAANEFCHEVARAVIKMRNGIPSDRGDIIDQLLGLKKNITTQMGKQREDDTDSIIEITDDFIAGQIFILYAAGYENNNLCLSYAMYHLAQDNYIQDILVAEIDEVLLKYGGKFTYDSLHEMKYLQMVFAETLRMHPLTNSIARTANVDYECKELGLTINKGTSVIISPYAIHHDEKHYPDPEKFHPERFAADVARDRHPCAYIPFGTGPRGCLGKRFASIQFGVCVVKLLSKFRVEVSSRTPLAISYDPWRTLLSPSGGLHLNLTPR